MAVLFSFPGSFQARSSLSQSHSGHRGSAFNHLWHQNRNREELELQLSTTELEKYRDRTELLLPSYRLSQLVCHMVQQQSPEALLQQNQRARGERWHGRRHCREATSSVQACKRVQPDSTEDRNNQHHFRDVWVTLCPSLPELWSWNSQKSGRMRWFCNAADLLTFGM